jgi:hypothetical protein
MYNKTWVQNDLNYDHKKIDESAEFRVVSLRYMH